MLKLFAFIGLCLLFSCSSDDCRTCLEVVTENTCMGGVTDETQYEISRRPIGEKCNINFDEFMGSTVEERTKFNCTIKTITIVTCKK